METRAQPTRTPRDGSSAIRAAAEGARDGRGEGAGVRLAREAEARHEVAAARIAQVHAPDPGAAGGILLLLGARQPRLQGFSPRRPEVGCARRTIPAVARAAARDCPLPR